MKQREIRTLAAEILWANALAAEEMDQGHVATAQRALQIARQSANIVQHRCPGQSLDSILDTVFAAEGSPATLVSWPDEDNGIRH